MPTPPAVAAPVHGGEPQQHLPHLDGLRGVAAMLVVLHHVWLTIWPIEAGPRAGAGGLDLSGAFAFGHFRVAVFIVLSGFCLTLPVARSGALRGGERAFFARRARRILPAYYAALALSLVLIGVAIGGETGTHWDRSVPVSLDGLLANVLLVQNLVAQGEINHVLWSLAVECQIYLAFPLLLLLWARSGVAALAAATGALVLAIGAASRLVPGAAPLLDGGTLQFLTLFALGMVGAIVCFSPAARTHALATRVPWRVVLALAAAGTAAGAFAARDLVLANLFLFDLLAGLATTALLVVTCTGGAPRVRAALGSRGLVFLGAFAYSTYLIHAPLLQLVWQYAIDPFSLSPRAAFAALVAFGVPFVLLSSYAFFLAFERPFLSKRRRRALGGLRVPDGADLRAAPAPQRV